MKRNVTNKLGLPEAIVHAVSNDPYDAGSSTDYSVTGLLKPARMAQLSKGAEVTEDAADLIYSIQGQVVHAILERAGHALREAGFITERRFYKKYVVDGKTFTVSAQIDIYDPNTGTLSDYKYTSVGAAKRGLKEDHRLQLNVQAELLRSGYVMEVTESGWISTYPRFNPKQAEVVLLLRDWTKMRAYDGYPESPAVKQVVQFMSSAEVDAWVVERIRAHEAAKQELPLCTAPERWNEPTFAVMKPGAAKATKVEDTEQDALAYIAAKGIQAEVVRREGNDTRCIHYCPARFVCKQALESNPSLSAPIPDADGFIKVS